MKKHAIAVVYPWQVGFYGVAFAADIIRPTWPCGRLYVEVERHDS